MIREAFGQVALHVMLLTALPAIPLIVLARRRVYPHTSLLAMLLVPCLLSLLLLTLPESLLLLILVDAAVLSLAAFDLKSLPQARTFSAQRELERVASLGKPHEVQLTVVNHRPRAYHAWLRDDLPESFEATPQEFVLSLKERSRTHLQYRFKPLQRGAFAMDFVHLRVRSAWGFWKRYLSCPVASAVHVYPNMVQLSEYALLARSNRLSLMGVRRSRRIGQDHDFERLRDYSVDDNYKHMDWRATARRNKLTVKEYQTSQSQRIVFLLDCGRMMNAMSAGLSLLDHALNAMLMLGYVALRQGDSVGLVCFSDGVHKSVPARGGMSQMNHLLHASFDRFPQLVESRYDLAFLHLATRFRKRALVVLVSNLIDEVNSFQVKRYLQAQVGRHLPLCVLLRDRSLFEAAEPTSLAGRNLYQAAAAAGILSWRQEVLSDLQHQGVLVLDVFPEELTAPLVNRYLDIKARHLL
ncbi:MAG: DUF58 domain-containing protein [Pirellulaceae bacterium]